MRINNKRLKLGNITADGATITADIVTVDNSLVQFLTGNGAEGMPASAALHPISRTGRARSGASHTSVVSVLKVPNR
jgi:hypothetical protein